jgi:hypothetical protein
MARKEYAVFMNRHHHAVFGEGSRLSVERKGQGYLGLRGSAGKPVDESHIAELQRKYDTAFTESAALVRAAQERAKNSD